MEPLFDRAREETKTAARPGFVEKAEASARARAEKEAARSGRSRAEKTGQSGRRGVTEMDSRSEQRRVAEKADREKPRASGNPVVRLPEKRAGNGIARPVVRLPEKRSVRPGTVKSENEGHSIRAAQWKSAGEETLKKARKLTKSAGKAFRRFGNTLEKRVREGKDRLSDRVKPSGQSSKPVRTAAARRGNGMRGSNASMRISRRVEPSPAAAQSSAARNTKRARECPFAAGQRDLSGTAPALADRHGAARGHGDRVLRVEHVHHLGQAHLRAAGHRQRVRIHIAG